MQRLEQQPKPKDEGDEGGDKKIDPSVKAKLDALERQNAENTKKLEQSEAKRLESERKAELTERNAEIRKEIQKYSSSFIDAAIAAEDFFRLISPQVSRDDDGSLIANDTTLEAFVKQQIESRPWLLKPEDKRGTGAGPGGSKGKVQIEDIKQGMSAETRKAALAELQKAARSLRDV
jgi:hypothetical protein